MQRLALPFTALWVLGCGSGDCFCDSMLWAGATGTFSSSAAPLLFEACDGDYCASVEVEALGSCSPAPTDLVDGFDACWYEDSLFARRTSHGPLPNEWVTLTVRDAAGVTLVDGSGIPEETEPYACAGPTCRYRALEL